MNKKPSLTKAFSLIELSIVVLIIGILIAAITQGSSLVEKMAINSARSLTASSPVNGISDLVAWYETTSEGSFLASVDPDSSTQNAVSTWNDINTGSTNKCNLSTTQSSNGFTATNAPILRRKAIGNLPAVLFDGATTYLSCDRLAAYFNGGDKEMTIFIVAKPNNIVSASQDSLVSLSSTQNSAHNMFFQISTRRSYYYFRSPVSSPSSPFNSTGMLLAEGVPIIISYTHHGSTLPPAYTSVSGYLNGKFQFTDRNDTNIPPISFNQFSIGAMTRSSPTGQYFYDGLLSEIIVFNRVLTNEELSSVHAYLKQKWGIK